MPDRLPPLTALRAFEAAARHMSFADAAAELNVTPAALSYQIKNLEEHLGAPLFRRLNRAVELTEAGRSLQPGVAQGFESLTRAWRSVRRRRDGSVLTVTAGPAFTATWLAPRLFGFSAAHPEIELRFVATLRLLDFERDDVDVAIRFGLGGDDGFRSERLNSEALTPVMVPELAARYPTAESLRDAPLIHDESLGFLSPPPDWAAWFTAAGLEPPGSRGAHFSGADQAIASALAGGGVLMGRLSLVSGPLREGTLVAPFPLTLTIDAHYRLVTTDAVESQPAFAKFRTWLLDELARDRVSLDGRTCVHVTSIARD
ncbi:transcriptional regulator GcvA [Oceanomicrobium pacificus]|uniref:Transcriptional regulator GcvA n=1 Tax=Oceanomicrobium pacificus TaxID=2692916 RepID=A0A6B0TN42_9RHOB|nr:transcriptional regulator GcvA [Oceanomicrobium pacificus]MXU63999.1 transcriptional regulator GcvA [Oceanomicrobium pacificus]